jgi:O-antigen/teichoic acid export membrane protein
VATADPSSYGDIFLASLTTRGIVAIPALAIAIVTAWVIVGHAALPAALTACVIALTGFSSDWFFIGTSDPRRLAVLEVLPRLVFLSLGMLATIATSSIIFYPAIYVIGVSAALLLTCMSIGLGSPRRLDIRSELRSLRAPAIAEFSGSSYSLGAAAIVVATVPLAQAASFSAADRLYKVALLAIIAMSQANQGWVARGIGQGRQRRAIQAHAVVGVIGCGFIALTLPYLVAATFGDDFRPSSPTAASLGLSFLAVSMSTALARYVLAPSGRSHVIVVSTVTAAVIGVPLIVVLSARFGAAGGAAGLAMSQLTVVVVQALLGNWDRPPRGRVTQLRPGDT